MNQIKAQERARKIAAKLIKKVRLIKIYSTKLLSLKKRLKMVNGNRYRNLWQARRKFVIMTRKMTSFSKS